jgi:hypothetical protein
VVRSLVAGCSNYLTATPETVPSLVDDLYHGFHDHAAWCRECLSIRDKTGRVVPLELWPAQLRLHALIKRQRERKKPVRIVFLKPRRVSVSVAAAAEIFHEVPFKPGQHGQIVAHDLDSTKEIFDYCQQFQDTYKPFQGVIGLPATVKDDERKLAWENGSYIRVATANNLKGGRSFGLRYLQLDEFAFWRNAQTLMAGLLSSVPDDPATMVLVISTANGVGGPFWELCQQAQNPSGDSDWVFLFFAWWEHPEYVRPLDVPGDVFQKSLGNSELYGDELAERSKYSLTLAQLNWRRWCILNKCQKRVEIFRQEYPGSPEEAFLTSGRPRLSQQALGRMAIIRDPVRGRLETDIIGTRTQVVFLPHEEGELAIYKQPQRGRLYCIGADPASGKDINDGKGNEDRDWCVASVLDADTGEQVAKVRLRMEPAPFGELLYTLGRYYNWAYLVPEANTWGIGVLEELLRRQYPIGQIYERHRSPADRETTSVHKIGFETTEVTRPQMISALDMAIREFSVLIRDANTLLECQKFVINARGRPEGQQGCHDDEVFALALAVIGLRTMPRVRPRDEPGEKRTPQRYVGRRLNRQPRTNTAEID